MSVAIDPTVSASYPVFLDPIGDFSQTGTANSWVTGANRAGLPRRNLIPSVTGTFSQRLRFCTLLDDLTYDATGTGAPTASVPVERGGRYNWLAIVQRPVRSSENLANLSILVFDGRAPGYAIPNGEAVFTPGTFTGTSLSFPYPTGARPPVSKGRWIALHTLVEATALLPTKTNVLQFYRVVSANDETPGQLDIELQTPISRDQDQATLPVTATTRVIVFSGLSEVFERPQLNGK